MTDEHTASRDHSRRWLILGLVGLAQLMVVLDATIVNIALPSAQKALHFSDGNRQWIVTAYALAFGSLLLLGGRLGDLFGRKRTFIIGLGGFAAASALGGMAQSFELLVAARALQGAFGALLAPAALSLLTTTFTNPDERGKAFGIFGAIAVGGGAMGLLLGGLLTEYLSWRWCLYVNLLIALPVIPAAVALLSRGVSAVKPRLDIPGTLTASGGLFALVYGFSHAETTSWTNGVTVGFIAAAIALLGAFVAIQRRAAHPLLPLRVVTDRNRGGAFLAVLIVGAGMFGVFLFLTYYLQQTLGYSPVSTGLAFLPMMGVIVVVSTLANTFLLARLGPKPLVPLGMGLAAVAMLLLTRLGLHSTYAADILPSLLLTGAGLGLVMAPAMSSATAGVQTADTGVASALVNTSQQIGGSVGTALLNTLATSAIASYAAAHHGAPAVAAHATLHGYTTAFTWSAAIFAVGAVLCGLLLRPGATRLEPGAEPVLAH
jgi:EmrB/QacA subfamily drug resistance transporter